MEEIQAAVENKGGDWASEQANFTTSSHGHNLFTNILVERGWLGVCVIGIFFVVMLRFFLKKVRYESSQVGILTLMVICLAGLGQSTLHVEHGQLAFICLALCLKLETLD